MIQFISQQEFCARLHDMAGFLFLPIATSAVVMGMVPVWLRLQPIVSAFTSSGVSVSAAAGLDLSIPNAPKETTTFWSGGSSGGGGATPASPASNSMGGANTQATASQAALDAQHAELQQLETQVNQINSEIGGLEAQMNSAGMAVPQ